MIIDIAPHRASKNHYFNGYEEFIGCSVWLCKSLVSSVVGEDAEEYDGFGYDPTFS